eukprot:766298-Hanusia_phi.AAC.6
MQSQQQWQRGHGDVHGMVAGVTLKSLHSPQLRIESQRERQGCARARSRERGARKRSSEGCVWC